MYVELWIYIFQIKKELLSCAGGWIAHAPTSSCMLELHGPHYLEGKWSVRNPGLGAAEPVANWGLTSSSLTWDHSWISLYDICLK